MSATIRHSKAGLSGRSRDGKPSDAETPPPDQEIAASDLTPLVGRNLRELRAQRGLSLEKLARLSGVSRAMLGQIELGQSAPTINILWKICRALDVTFSAVLSGRGEASTVVLPARRAKRLTSEDGAFSSRALFPTDAPRRVEFYELRLAPHSEENAEAHSPGTQENLVVSEGAVEISLGDTKHTLGPGDAILFTADIPHTYRNPGAAPTILYLVMTYADR